MAIASMVCIPFDSVWSRRCPETLQTTFFKDPECILSTIE